MKAFVTLLLTFSFVGHSTSITIKCWFGEASYWKTFDKPYACVDYEVSAKENIKETITGVTGSIKEGLTNDDVIVLDLRGFFNIIPTGFDKFFKNLLGFSVYNTQLITISSDDLVQFPKLRELWIYSNVLEYLPSNLLDNNPDIEYIHFHSNQIKFIGSEFFSKVPKLYGADFSSNVCINKSAGDSKALQSLIKDIKKKCSSNAAVGDNFHKITILKTDLLLLKISKLEKEIKKLESLNKNEC